MLEAYFILPKLSAISFPALVVKGFRVVILSVIFLTVPGAVFVVAHFSPLTTLPPKNMSTPN